MNSEFLLIFGIVLIILCNLSVYIMVGIVSKRSAGNSPKFDPFMGGEENIPPRGHYRSELFVFAVLFLVAESYALILVGSYLSLNVYNVLLYLLGGAAVILISIWWLVTAGGVRI